jgi:hypothetical protein
VEVVLVYGSSSRAWVVDCRLQTWCWVVVAHHLQMATVPRSLVLCHHQSVKWQVLRRVGACYRAVSSCCKQHLCNPPSGLALQDVCAAWLRQQLHLRLNIGAP